MIKPFKLKKGDNIASVSLSWGIAGESAMLPKYNIAKDILEKEFDINIISAPNSMRGEKFLKENPRTKADDLIWALENKNVNGIFSNIGGNDSINILPFIDINIIKNNPKVFMGSSDIFAVHTLYSKAEVTSFYGGNLLTMFSGIDEIDRYTLNNIDKVLFETKPIGKMGHYEKYCIEDKLECFASDDFEIINGTGIIKGKLFICTSELVTIQKSAYSLPAQAFKDVILCFEDIIECVTPNDLYNLLIWLYEEEILQQINALVIAKFNEIPQNSAYKEAVIKALSYLSLRNLPIIMSLDFGHTFPKTIMPYGVTAEIDLVNGKFIIVENAVI